MADNNVLFKKKIGGYDRKAVNEYIAESNRVFAEKEADFSKKLERLNEEKESLTAELDALRASGAEAVANAEKTSSTIAEKDARIESLVAELDAQKMSTELEIKDKDEQIARLNEKAVSDRVSYEAETAKVREECRLALTERDKEVDSIRDEYRRMSEEQYSMVEAAAYRMRDKMAAELRGVTKDCLREILRGIDEMKTDSESMKESANGSYERMNESIDRYEARMKDEVRRIIDEFKKGSDGSNE